VHYLLGPVHNGTDLSQKGREQRHSREGGNPECAVFEESGFRVSTSFRPE